MINSGAGIALTAKHMPQVLLWFSVNNLKTSYVQFQTEYNERGHLYEQWLTSFCAKDAVCLLTLVYTVTTFFPTTPRSRNRGVVVGGFHDGFHWFVACRRHVCDPMGLSRGIKIFSFCTKNSWTAANTNDHNLLAKRRRTFSEVSPTTLGLPLTKISLKLLKFQNLRGSLTRDGYLYLRVASASTIFRLVSTGQDLPSCNLPLPANCPSSSVEHSWYWAGGSRQRFCLTSACFRCVGDMFPTR